MNNPTKTLWKHLRSFLPSNLPNVTTFEDLGITPSEQFKSISYVHFSLTSLTTRMTTFLSFLLFIKMSHLNLTFLPCHSVTVINKEHSGLKKMSPKNSDENN